MQRNSTDRYSIDKYPTDKHSEDYSFEDISISSSPKNKQTMKLVNKKHSTISKIKKFFCCFKKIPSSVSSSSMSSGMNSNLETNLNASLTEQNIKSLTNSQNQTESTDIFSDTLYFESISSMPTSESSLKGIYIVDKQIEIYNDDMVSYSVDCNAGSFN